MYLFQAYALNADSTDEPIRLLATLPTGATGDIDNNVDDDILSSFIIVVIRRRDVALMILHYDHSCYINRPSHRLDVSVVLRSEELSLPVWLQFFS